MEDGSRTGSAPAARPETDPRVARRRKLAELEAGGIDPFPSRWAVDARAVDLLDRFEDGGPGVRGRLAGRVVGQRAHGRTTFLHLADASGRIQVYARRDELGEAGYRVVEGLDLGDVVGVAGSVFRTRTGEVTIRAEELVMLAKALRPLPIGKEIDAGGERRAFHRVTDVEFRYRQRYADLAIRPELREVFRTRAAVVSWLRGFLEDRGFLEVETPVLQPVYGGASARPFVTHHHALDMPLYLRIADELYLKRCVIGGLERVYEISKDFRNEGVDRLHNPEFTMLEFYQAYADYNDLMELTEAILAGLTARILGGTTIDWQGQGIDVAPPWPRVRYLDALAERGVAVDDLSREALTAEARRHGLVVGPSEGAGRLLDALFGAIVEPDLDGPAFVVDHPEVLSPLAKRHPDDPRLVQRFEAYLFGTEWANAFTELNDPRDQRERLERQAAAAAAGDREAPNVVDEDFLRALEYGMPPTAGMGVGIDRLVMFLTDQPSIRDVILFPTLRPEEGRDPIADGEDG